MVMQPLIRIKSELLTLGLENSEVSDHWKGKRHIDSLHDGNVLQLQVRLSI